MRDIFNQYNNYDNNAKTTINSFIASEKKYLAQIEQQIQELSQLEENKITKNIADNFGKKTQIHHWKTRKDLFNNLPTAWGLDEYKPKPTTWFNNKWYPIFIQARNRVFNFLDITDVTSKIRTIITNSINLQNLRTIKYLERGSVIDNLDTKNQITELNKIINNVNTRRTDIDPLTYINTLNRLITFIKGDIQLLTYEFFSVDNADNADNNDINVIINNITTNTDNVKEFIANNTIGKNKTFAIMNTFLQNNIAFQYKLSSETRETIKKDFEELGYNFNYSTNTQTVLGMQDSFIERDIPVYLQDIYNTYQPNINNNNNNNINNINNPQLIKNNYLLLVLEIREKIIGDPEKSQKYKQIADSFVSDRDVNDFLTEEAAEAEAEAAAAAAAAAAVANTGIYTNTFIEKDGDKYDVESVGTYNNENKFFDLRAIYDEVFTELEEINENVNIRQDNVGP